MVGNPQRYRAALQQLESRHATAGEVEFLREPPVVMWYVKYSVLNVRFLGPCPAGCLLALLLLLPLAARSVPVALLSVAVLLYVTLVVPVATGFLSATVVIGWLR